MIWGTKRMTGVMRLSAYFIVLQITLQGAGVRGSAIVSADDVIRAELENVRISRTWAAEGARLLGCFSRWHERYQMINGRGIHENNFDPFLRQLKLAYESVTRETVQQLRLINYADFWYDKVVEFNFTCSAILEPGRSNTAQYGLIALSKIRGVISFKFILFTFDFQLPRGIPVTNRARDFLTGTLNADDTRALQNYFRKQAITSLYEEGAINNVNYIA